MNTTRMVFFWLLVSMTVAPVFTALYDGSFTSDGEQKLTFPMSYHYEALYGDIFVVNIANYLVLEILPQTIPWYYHTGIYGACLVGSWLFFHKPWAPLSGDKPMSHFFKKTHYYASAQYPLNAKRGWWKSFSVAGWLHLFFFSAAITLAIEYAFFARHLPAEKVLTIGFLYFVFCLIAVMGYHTAISHAELKVGYDKAKELAYRFAAVAIVTVVKLPMVKLPW